MKKKRILLITGAILGIIILFTSLFAYMAFFRGFYAGSDKPVGEYVGTANLQFLGNKECYRVATNKYDQPIFENPAAAFSQASADYEVAINLIYETFQSEYHLEPFSKKTYHMYKVLGWQITTDDENIYKQGSDLTKFLDIYENSEKRWFLTSVGWNLEPR